MKQRAALESPRSQSTLWNSKSQRYVQLRFWIAAPNTELKWVHQETFLKIHLLKQALPQFSSRFQRNWHHLHADRDQRTAILSQAILRGCCLAVAGLSERTKSGESWCCGTVLSMTLKRLPRPSVDVPSLLLLLITRRSSCCFHRLCRICGAF